MVIYLYILLCWKDSVQDYVYVRSYKQNELDEISAILKKEDCRLDEITN